MNELLTAEVVRTRRLEVEDEDGVVRAIVDCNTAVEDAVTLQMLTPKSQLGLFLLCTENGAEIALFQPRSHQGLVSVTSNAAGLAKVTLYSPSGAEVFRLENDEAAR